jgi:glycosidase
MTNRTKLSNVILLAAVFVSALLAISSVGYAQVSKASLPLGGGEWRDQIVYVVIPGKFFDGNTANDYEKTLYNLPNPAYSGGYPGGDLQGVREKMGYLKSLGVTTILLYPVYDNDTNPIPGMNVSYLAGGYRVKDYHAIDPNLGTIDDYKGLIADLHRTDNGPRLSIIQDIPSSLTGTQYPWFANAANFPWRFRPWDAQTLSNNVGQSPLHMPYGDVDNGYGVGVINAAQGVDSNSGTYAALRDDIIFWQVDHYDIDGLRYDSAQDLPNVFWETLMRDFRQKYGATKPGFVNFAEDMCIFKKPWEMYASDMVNDHPSNPANYVGLTGAYDFGIIHFIQVDLAGGGDLHDLVNNSRSTDRAMSNSSDLSDSVDIYEDSTFLSQVHDGNGKERLHLALAFIMTFNRVPFLYSGNEYGMNYMVPGALFSPNQDQQFRAGVDTLVKIRRGNPAFSRGTLKWLTVSSNLISYERSYEGKTFVVVLNCSASPQSVIDNVSDFSGSTAGIHNLLDPTNSGIQAATGAAGTQLSLTLAPWEAKIIALQN